MFSDMMESHQQIALISHIEKINYFNSNINISHDNQNLVVAVDMLFIASSLRKQLFFPTCCHSFYKHVLQTVFELKSHDFYGFTFLEETTQSPSYDRYSFEHEQLSSNINAWLSQYVWRRKTIHARKMPTKLGKAYLVGTLYF